MIPNDHYCPIDLLSNFAAPNSESADESTSAGDSKTCNPSHNNAHPIIQDLAGLNNANQEDINIPNTYNQRLNS